MFPEELIQPLVHLTIIVFQILGFLLLIGQNRTNEIIKYFQAYGNQQLLKNLGELQTPYQTFIQSFITFKDFLNNGFYLRKKNMLLTDMLNIQKLNTILRS